MDQVLADPSNQTRHGWGKRSSSQYHVDHPRTSLQVECKRKGAEPNEVRDLTLFYHPSRNVWRAVARLTPTALRSHIRRALINPDASELYRVTYLERRDAVCASLSITSFLKTIAERI